MATKAESVQVGVVNGSDVKALNGTIEAVKGNPAIAQATFAVESVLERGFNTRAKTGPITLGGQALAGRTKAFRFEGDHPPELLGHDQGPAAVETLLAALGACVSRGVPTDGAAPHPPTPRSSASAWTSRGTSPSKACSGSLRPASCGPDTSGSTRRSS